VIVRVAANPTKSGIGVPSILIFIEEGWIMVGEWRVGVVCAIVGAFSSGLHRFSATEATRRSRGQGAVAAAA